MRLHVESGGWVLRGGTLAGEVLWVRGEQERSAVADGFTGTSPAYDLAVLAGLGDGEHRLHLVEVTEPVLATRTVDVAWVRAGDAWTVTDLATGERRSRRLADGLPVGDGLTLTRA